MAREFNMTYIPHDVDASCDPKCIALVEESGMAAYGRYWMLLELFARSSDGFIDLAQPGATATIRRELRFSNARLLEAFLATLAKIGLIDADMLDRGKVMSDSFLRRREQMEANYLNGKKGGRPKKDGKDNPGV